MKSIRRRLLAWFLPCLGALWLAGGAGVFLSYRAGLLAGLEAELQSLLRQVRSTRGMPPGGGPGWGGMRRPASPAEDEFGPGVYWQVWPLDGSTPGRSDNLSEDLPRFGGEHGTGGARVLTLRDGVRVLAAGGRYGGGKAAEAGGGRWGAGGRGGAVEVSVARDLAGVHRALARAAGGICLAGLAVAAAAVWWVRHALRDGLAPLRRIADEVAAIDATSLGGRFADRGLPEELRPIVARLNQLMERLEEGFARERRFSSDLAHEMRTPVAELRVLAESALKWPAEGGGEAWAEVRGAVERMETVVQAMLQLARLEQATPGEAGEPIALRALVEELWAPHAARAGHRGLTLRLDVDPAATATGDRALCGHLLNNLLENAARHADAGSEVRVTCAPPATGSAGVVCVANAASALDPGDLGRLFDRFWRGDAARSDAGHCGLGLALARACAEAMGWRLEARLHAAPGGPRQLEMRIETGPAAAG